MRRFFTVVMGVAPGALLATEDGLNPTTVLAAIGTLVAGLIAAIALLRRQDTDAAIKSMQDMLDRQEATIKALQADHATCEEKHNEIEKRFSVIVGWLRRNRSAMETSGVKLEPLPPLE